MKRISAGQFCVFTALNRSITARVPLFGILIVISAGILGNLKGCGGTEKTEPHRFLQKVLEENQEARESRIIMAGSTSMEKFANILAESFMAEHPDITVTAEFTGSSAGVEAVLAGRADIGIASRELTEEERAEGAVGIVVAIDGIAVITDKDNPVRALTAEQLAEIYTGKIRNWQEIGGRDDPIVVTGREAGSGTRSTFEERLGIRDRCLYANEMDSEGAVFARAVSTPGAVGYVSFAVLNDKVCTFSIDGAEATEENVKAGSYPLSRPFLMVTKGQIDEQKAVVREFFDYLQSETGDGLIRAAGLTVPEKQEGIQEYK